MIPSQQQTPMSLCYARLKTPQEEDTRRFAYDDSTGRRVSCLPNGRLTIAVGVNLETGLDSWEIEALSMHRLELVHQQLSAFAWYQAASAARQSVFLDVAFNAGVEGLLHFPKMLHFAAIGQWQSAADQLLDSDAARQRPERYQRLAAILRGDP